MTRFYQRYWKFLIIFGMAIRFMIAFLPGFKLDVDTWFSWSQRLNELGFARFYSDQIWTNYTPGYLYILSLLGHIKNLFHLDDSSFYLLLKFPSIIAEVVLGVIVYKWFSRKSLIWATISSLAIIFNPAFIFNSSIWGQIDGLFSLLLVTSIYLLNKGRLILSSVFFAFAFLIKPQTIAILPIFILFGSKNFSIRKIIKLILPALLVILTLSLPFFINQPIMGIWKLFLKMTSDYPQTSLFAYNVWGIIGFWIPDNQLWFNLSYQTIGFLLFVIYWLIITYFYFKKGLSIFALAALATLGFYFLPTRVHERYLYPAIVFLVLTAAHLKSKKLFLTTIVLTILHFLNLYFVYVYYNEIYLKLPKILLSPWIYNLVNNNAETLSLLSTYLFLIITTIIINENDQKSFKNKKA